MTQFYVKYFILFFVNVIIRTRLVEDLLTTNIIIYAINPMRLCIIQVGYEKKFNGYIWKIKILLWLIIRPPTSQN